MVAQKLHELSGSENADLHNVDSASADDLENYRNIILGTSTWGIGDMQDDMEDFLELLENSNLKDKKVALFGLGDQETYPDSFVDGIGSLYNHLKDKTTVVGFWPNKGYHFTDSDAIEEGHFVGLVIDQDNQADKTPERLKEWVSKIKKDFDLE